MESPFAGLAFFVACIPFAGLASLLIHQFGVARKSVRLGHRRRLGRPRGRNAVRAAVQVALRAASATVHVSCWNGWAVGVKSTPARTTTGGSRYGIRIRVTYMSGRALGGDVKSMGRSDSGGRGVKDARVLRAEWLVLGRQPGGESRWQASKFANGAKFRSLPPSFAGITVGRYARYRAPRFASAGPACGGRMFSKSGAPALGRR